MMLKFKTSEAAGEHPPASPILNLFFYLIFIIQGTSNFKLLEFNLYGIVVLIKIRNRIYELEHLGLKGC